MPSCPPGIACGSIVRQGMTASGQAQAQARAQVRAYCNTTRQGDFRGVRCKQFKEGQTRIACVSALLLVVGVEAGQRATHPAAARERCGALRQPALHIGCPLHGRGVAAGRPHLRVAYEEGRESCLCSCAARCRLRYAQTQSLVAVSENDPVPALTCSVTSSTCPSAVAYFAPAACCCCPGRPTNLHPAPTSLACSPERKAERESIRDF